MASLGVRIAFQSIGEPHYKHDKKNSSQGPVRIKKFSEDQARKRIIATTKAQRFATVH